MSFTYIFQYVPKFPIAFIDDVQMYMIIIVNIVTVKLYKTRDTGGRI
jgi:hypothetical protein